MEALVKQKYFVPGIALALLFLLYFPSLHYGAFVDDNSLIFGNSFIKSSQNPLQYWYRGQMNTKAWPLTHSVYWLLYQGFHLNFALYRSALILLHWANGFCLFLFLRKKSFAAALFSASLFWLSPITVEAVTWISQIGCLLSTLFFAFWLRDFLEEKPASPLRSNALLVAMMITKSYAFFLAPMEIFKNAKILGWKKSLLHSSPALLFSVYSAFLVSHGIYDYPTEAEHSASYFLTNPPKPAELVAAPTKEAPIKKTAKIRKSKKILTTPIAVKAEAPPAPIKHEERYLQDQFAKSPEAMKEKLEVEGRTFSYYLLRSLSFTEIPVRTKQTLAGLNWLFLLLSVASLGLFIWGLAKRYWLLSVTFATYLSISGLFYVPFMKLSLVADRVAYLPLFAFIWGLGELYLRVENKYILKAFWLWPILFCLLTFFVIREPRAEFPIL